MYATKDVVSQSHPYFNNDSSNLKQEARKNPSIDREFQDLNQNFRLTFGEHMATS